MACLSLIFISNNTELAAQFMPNEEELSLKHKIKQKI